MKKILTVIASLILTASVFAQAPEKMSYQAVIRDVSNNLTTNQTVGMQISILQTSATGTAVYVETQTPTTNANGLVSFEIGTGTVISGNFTTIDWSAGPYFIKTETDPAGGTNYTITGTSQLLSVPYALHAKTAESITGTVNYTETDPVFGASVANGITAVDTVNWNNHTVDTDTHIDSVGIAGLGYVAGGITTESDPVFAASISNGITAVDTANWNNHTVDTDTHIDSTGIAGLGYVAGAHSVVTAGTNVTVTGAGTTASPYVVNHNTYQIGDFAQGGIIFWLDETGEHGLVCAKTDQDDGSGIRWNAGANGLTRATGDGPFSGEANTTLAIAAHFVLGDDGNDYAAQLCNNLKVTENSKTYGDWYLPSKEELNLMYQNKLIINATSIANGGNAFASLPYWTSTENNNTTAWYLHFANSFIGVGNKYNIYRVRAIRAF